jgi:hypothetical protein
VISRGEKRVERAPDGRQARREFRIREIEQPLRAREDLLSPRDALLDCGAPREERARDLARAEAAQDVEG